MQSVKVLNKGQIVIPAALRKKYDIRPGNQVQLFEYGRLIYLVPNTDDPVQDAKGCLPTAPSLSGELLADRQRERSD